MYLLITYSGPHVDAYYGPFPNEKRAEKYAKAMGKRTSYQIVPLIVPYNLIVTVKERTV